MADIVITGAGGFIGAALAAQLSREGKSLRCVDRKPLDEWFQPQPDAENAVADLQEIDACRSAVRGAGTVYQLGADMGGMGFADKQTAATASALREEDTYPAMPVDGYGWGKLFTERMCRHFHEDFGLATRVARFHNVYGPEGTFDGGREKAPAALARKVAHAVLSSDPVIEIWGDDEQARSCMSGRALQPSA